MKKITLFLVLCLLWTGAMGQQTAPVRNLIYLIGDGMGLADVSVLEIANDYAPTAFSRVENVGLVTTRSANNRVTDSAAAGTALACGVKTNNGMLGQTPDGTPVQSLIARASAEGMPTGIVVTCYLQHATPAAFYAHVPKRSQSEAISRQMVDSKVDVLIGGGRKWLAEEYTDDDTCLDAFARGGYRVIDTLPAADTITRGRLLGVLAEEHLPHAAERGNYLPAAVNKALEILSNNAAQSGKGFVLMVEGSQIDMAAHANDTQWMLDEMRDFERAVAAAMDFADRTPGTLVVVVADHETGGVAIPGNEDDFTRAESGLQYHFSGHGHTAIRVPVYFYGAGAEQINGLMENTELSQGLAKALGLK